MRALFLLLLLLFVAGCDKAPPQKTEIPVAETQAKQELKDELEKVRQQAERAEKEASGIKKQYEADKLAAEIKAKELAEEQRIAREIEQTFREATEKARKEAAFQALVDRFNSLDALDRLELNSLAKKAKDGTQLNAREQERMDQLGWNMSADFIIEYHRAGVAAARAVSAQKQTIKSLLNTLNEKDREELQAIVTRMSNGEKLDRKHLDRLAEIGGAPFHEYVESELKLLDEKEAK